MCSLSLIRVIKAPHLLSLIKTIFALAWLSLFRLLYFFKIKDCTILVSLYPRSLDQIFERFFYLSINNNNLTHSFHSEK